MRQSNAILSSTDGIVKLKTGSIGAITGGLTPAAVRPHHLPSTSLEGHTLKLNTWDMETTDMSDECKASH